MPKLRVLVALVIVGLSGAAPSAEAGGGKKAAADSLRRAEEFVARSDRYLHQSKLKRGMKGYGLTVMTGAKIEKFDAAVLSVLHNWYPHQDVVLCRLSGLGLEKTGIISGMSGSPVFVKDPADGKDKMIGAVAYGWRFPKEAVCGVQPIAQMLAIAGVPLGAAGGRKARAEAPGKAAAGAGAAGAGRLDEDFVRAVLNCRKVRFAGLFLPPRGGGRRGGRRGLSPLPTPVMVSGVSGRTLELAEKFFEGTGLLPVRAGTVGAQQARAASRARLAPGMALSVPLVAGDADWAAVGTATEVIGDYVLALGHSFNAEGPVELPMGPAYVHTVVASALASFKLGSTLKITGALTADEYTGVGGRIGRRAPMVPMTVQTRWGQADQKFQYRLVRHRRLTSALSYFLLGESVLANRDLPQRHTVEYSVEIAFGKLGTYRADNVSSGDGLWDVASDLERPVAALMNTALGPPVVPERIAVKVAVLPVQKTAALLRLQLDRNMYRPGQTVRGRATLRPFRAERIARDVSMELPKDLPDGKYVLTVCDAFALAEQVRADSPHRFRPRTVPQLFEAIQRVVAPRADRLYVHLALPDGGLAVRKNELDHLPPSLAEILARAAPIDSSRYRRRKQAEFPVEYVVSGSAEAGFEVRKEPDRSH